MIPIPINLQEIKGRRNIKPPTRNGYADLISFALTIAEDLEDREHRNYKEAINGKESNLWIEAMESEMNSLKKNDSWTLVDV